MMIADRFDAGLLPWKSIVERLSRRGDGATRHFRHSNYHIARAEQCFC